MKHKDKCDEFCQRHREAIKEIDKRSVSGYASIHRQRAAVARSFQPKTPKFF